jgi:hypothetical protein
MNRKTVSSDSIEGEGLLELPHCRAALQSTTTLN